MLRLVNEFSTFSILAKYKRKYGEKERHGKLFALSVIDV